MMMSKNFCPASPEEYRNQISRWIRPFNLYTDGWHSGETFLNYSALTHTALLKAHCGQDIEIRRAHVDECYILHLPVKGSFINYVNGRGNEIRGSEALLVPPCTWLNLIFPKDSEALILRIDEKFFRQNLLRVTRKSLQSLSPGQGYRIDAGNEAGLLLHRAINYLMAEADAMSGPIGIPAFIYNLEIAINCRIITAFGLAGPEAQACYEDKRAERIAAEATRFLSQHAEERLSVKEVAHHCGVSPRTLQRAFMSVHGMSPLTWLKHARLRGVRSDIINHATGMANITTIALSWGFSDLGRFAAHYRTLFGELPSETLRFAKSR